MIHGLSDHYGLTLWNGVKDSAMAHGADSVCFPAVDIGTTQGFEIQANILYDIASKENVDGLVLTGGIMSGYIGAEKYAEFVKKYLPLPLVTIGVPAGDIPLVTTDGYMGAHEAMNHLVKEHGYRRIAFIAGRTNNVDAEIRFKAYRDVLAENGLPFDPAMVSGSGNFDEISGSNAIRLFLDERKADFDAVFAANDHMAVGAIMELRKRNIDVPGKVAIIGYDDSDMAAFSTPALSTVRQPLYDEAYKAAELVISLIQGKNIHGKTTLSTVFVKRQSCGCLLSSVTRANANAGRKPTINWKADIISKRSKILDEIENKQSTGGKESHWSSPCLDAFIDELEGGRNNKRTQGLFIKTLSSFLNEMITQGTDISSMEDCLSSMRRVLLPRLLNNFQVMLYAEDLWHQARALLLNAALRDQAFREFKNEELSNTVQRINRSLAMSFDVSELMNVLAEELPAIEITSCYIFLYDNPESPLEGLRLFLSMTRNKKTDLPPEGLELKPGKIVPDEFLRSGKPLSYIVEPLYFRMDQIGVAVLDGSQKNGAVYENLRSQISSSLKGALLLQRLIRHDKELSAGIEGLNTALEKISGSIGDITQNMSEQASAVEEVASSIEEMTRNIGETTKITNTVLEYSDNLFSEASEGGKLVKNSIEAIQEVKENSQQILDLLGMINDIAEKTNLLSINASIQAAHSGQAGRGFSVVATEIRKLADNTNNNIKGIENAVKLIVSKITESTDAAHMTGAGLFRILGISEKDKEITSHLNSAMQEQNNGVQEILKSSQELLKITDNVHTAMTMQHKATEDFKTLLEKLRTR
ncbi:MAG: substrate-binding domain-containing protein [Spirochaetales bacterium]|nr:substrate-binding domain-containing protein [Spirochaetales bacterium]